MLSAGGMVAVHPLPAPGAAGGMPGARLQALAVQKGDGLEATEGGAADAKPRERAYVPLDVARSHVTGLASAVVAERQATERLGRDVDLHYAAMEREAEGRLRATAEAVRRRAAERVRTAEVEAASAREEAAVARAEHAAAMEAFASRLRAQAEEAKEREEAATRRGEVKLAAQVRVGRCNGRRGALERAEAPACAPECCRGVVVELGWRTVAAWHME